MPTIPEKILTILQAALALKITTLSSALFLNRFQILPCFLWLNFVLVTNRAITYIAVLPTKTPK